MTRFSNVRSHPFSPVAKASPRWPRGKELDLVLLASCSCLITLLSHPVAQALQTPAANIAAQTPVTNTAQRSPQLAQALYVFYKDSSDNRRTKVNQIVDEEQ